MQDVLMIAIITLAFMGASCLLILCKFLLLRIDRERGEILAMEEHVSRIERAPVLDMIYSEEDYASGP